MNATMTEDQFKRLLEQNNTQLLKHIDERLDERLDQKSAVLFGQLSPHFDKQFSALRNELKADYNCIYNAVDGIDKRLEDEPSCLR